MLFLQQEHRSFSYEIIIVDDGSKDKTTEVCDVQIYSTDYLVLTSFSQMLLFFIISSICNLYKN